MPSVHWCCWLGGRKGIQPVKIWVVGCWHGCLKRGADFYMAQLMLLPLTVSCSNTALCPVLPGWAGTRKVKPVWILLKQETVSGSGISWAHMQVCTSLQADNHASTPPLSFLQAGCPSCHPTNSIKALKADSGPLNGCVCFDIVGSVSERATGL